LATALGTLGYTDLTTALAARPGEMVSVSPELWALLGELHRGGGFALAFRSAWENGVAFLRATEGLRERRPAVIEWRGGQKQPGDEPVPADLRIDHVFLVSCKYLSKIVTNSSPANVFDRLLGGGHGGRGADWYAEVALDAYEELYRSARGHVGLAELPSSVLDLTTANRRQLRRALGAGRWDAHLRGPATVFARAVSEATANRWRGALRDVDLERVLWRLLRIGGAPYFVLGSAATGSLRLRVGTAWDWRQSYRLSRFAVSPVVSEQPVVSWVVDVISRRTGATTSIEGHVEIRWSHGKFAQPPEAKVYLDTPHHLVAGYWPLR
jgi:hypothetical protein